MNLMQEKAIEAQVQSLRITYFFWLKKIKNDLYGGEHENGHL